MNNNPNGNVLGSQSPAPQTRTDGAQSQSTTGGAQSHYATGGAQSHQATGGAQSHQAMGGAQSHQATGVAAIGAQAKEAASELMGQTTALVKGQVAREGGRRLEDLTHVAEALRKTGSGLEGNMAAPYIGMAADQIERVSDYLRTAEPKQIAKSVESFARREPLLFLGGAFALGMLGARFIKSTREGASPVNEAGR